MRYAPRSGVVMRDLMFWTTCALLLSGCWLVHRGSDEESPQIQDRVDPSLPSARRTAFDASVPVEPEPESEPEPEPEPDPDPDPRCTTRKLTKGEKFSPVDMVWVVDSSRSMFDEQSRIQQIMNEFVEDAQARNFDVRLVMVTDRNIVPAPLGADSGRYRFVQRDVGSHEPLQALLDEWLRYADFLRPEAALHFVIVTDDDSDLSPAEFKRQLDRRLERPYTVHAVASPDIGGQPCLSERQTEECTNASGRSRAICGAAAIGRAYLELAAQSGGEEISICVDDWREVFGPLLEAVTPTDIPCTIELGDDQALGATRVEILVGKGAQRLVQVAGPLACEAQASGYYFVDRAEGPQLTLCPRACMATTGDGVTLIVSTFCE